MKVRLLTSMAQMLVPDGPVRGFAPGEIYECSPAEGRRLIELERAEPISETKAGRARSGPESED